MFILSFLSFRPCLYRHIYICIHTYIYIYINFFKFNIYIQLFSGGGALPFAKNMKGYVSNKRFGTTAIEACETFSCRYYLDSLENIRLKVKFRCVCYCRFKYTMGRRKIIIK